MCLKLVTRDHENNTRKAESNAQSWESCAALKVYEFVYPEFDFPLHISGKDSPKVQQRVTLRHHNTLFSCMRPWSIERIQDHADYDPGRDSWADKTGRKRPRTVRELPDVFLSVVDEGASHQPGRTDESGTNCSQFLCRSLF